MKRSIPGLLLFSLAVLFPGFAQESGTLDEALKNAAVYINTELPPLTKVVVAAFQAPSQALADYVIEELPVYILGERKLILVDRRDLRYLEEEQQYQLSGEVSDETALAIGKRLGAQSIITGSIIAVDNSYRFRVRIIDVESAAIQGLISLPVRSDPTLLSLIRSPEAPSPASVAVPAKEPAPLPSSASRFPVQQSSWKDKLFYFGAGVQLFEGTYTYTDEFAKICGPLASSDVASVKYALTMSIQFYRNFALQTEFIFGKDTLSTGSREAGTFQVNSLILPILTKLTFRPGIFSFQASIGPYFYIPLESIECSWNKTPPEMDYHSSLGYLYGFHLGIKLGPGVLYGEFRRWTDLMALEADVPGHGFTSLFSATGTTWFFGYECGFFNRR